MGRIQGRTDIPLNETGIQQAKSTGAFLKEAEWDILITSPMKRAKETAEIINQELHISLIEMEEFIEKNFGDAEGMTFEEINTAYPDRKYPNQEERDALHQRIMEGLEKITMTYPNAKIVLVAHGGVINAILSLFSNGEIGYGKTRLKNACLSNIHFYEKQWIIKDFNQTPHL